MSDEDESKDMETNIFRKRVSKVSNARDVFQPIRIRRSSILSYLTDRKHILRKRDFVLHIGVVLWIIFLISQIL
jgi:hypothetical protein